MSDEIDDNCVTHHCACDCREQKAKEVLAAYREAIELTEKIMNALAFGDEITRCEALDELKPECRRVIAKSVDILSEKGEGKL